MRIYNQPDKLSLSNVDNYFRFKQDSLNEFDYFISPYVINPLSFNRIKFLGNFRTPGDIKGFGTIDTSAITKPQFNNNVRPDILTIASAPGNIVKYDSEYGTINSASLRIINMQLLTGNPDGNLSLLFEEDHNLLVDDLIIIDKDNKSLNLQYDGEASVIEVIDNKRILINKYWSDYQPDYILTEGIYIYYTTTLRFKLIRIPNRCDYINIIYNSQSYLAGFQPSTDVNPCYPWPAQRINIGNTIQSNQDNYFGWMNGYFIGSMTQTTDGYIQLSIPQGYGYKVRIESSPEFIVVDDESVDTGYITSITRKEGTLGIYNVLNGRRNYNDRYKEFGYIEDNKVLGTYSPTIGDNEYESYMFASKYGAIKTFVELYTGNTLNSTFVIGSFSSIYSNLYEIPVGTQNFIDLGINLSNINSYKVKIVNELGTYSLVEKTISNPCWTFDTLKFAYLNKNGVYDYLKLNGNNKRTNNFTRVESNKRLNWNYSNGDRDVNQYDVYDIENYSFNTDWINENTLSQVEDLMLSDDVYLVDILQPMGIYGLDKIYGGDFEQEESPDFWTFSNFQVIGSASVYNKEPFIGNDLFVNGGFTSSITPWSYQQFTHSIGMTAIGNDGVARYTAGAFGGFLKQDVYLKTFGRYTVSLDYLNYSNPFTGAIQVRDFENTLIRGVSFSYVNSSTQSQVYDFEFDNYLSGTYSIGIFANTGATATGLEFNSISVKERNSDYNGYIAQEIDVYGNRQYQLNFKYKSNKDYALSLYFKNKSIDTGIISKSLNIMTQSNFTNYEYKFLIGDSAEESLYDMSIGIRKDFNNLFTNPNFDGGTSGWNLDDFVYDPLNRNVYYKYTTGQYGGNLNTTAELEAGKTYKLYFEYNADNSFTGYIQVSNGTSSVYYETFGLDKTSSTETQISYIRDVSDCDSLSIKKEIDQLKFGFYYKLNAGGGCSLVPNTIQTTRLPRVSGNISTNMGYLVTNSLGTGINDISYGINSYGVYAQLLTSPTRVKITSAFNDYFIVSEENNNGSQFLNIVKEPYIGKAFKEVTFTATQSGTHSFGFLFTSSGTKTTGVILDNFKVYEFEDDVIDNLGFSIDDISLYELKGADLTPIIITNDNLPNKSDIKDGIFTQNINYKLGLSKDHRLR